MQHKRLLRDLGLTELEAQLYLAALGLGSATILQLAKASGVKRTTIYSVIESLKDKGLMSLEFSGIKRRFVAENPEKLEAMLEFRRTTLRQGLPELAAIYNLKGNESFIKYYEGLGAMKGVYNGLIRDVRLKEDYFVISNQDRWYNHDPVFFEDFMRRRSRLDINLRLLLVDTAMARDFKKRQNLYNQQIKLLPATTVLTTNLVIIPKKVVIHQTIPPLFAMIIENKSIVQMHREMFKILWSLIQD